MNTSATIPPEFIRPNKVPSVFGISRTLTFELLNSGQIESRLFTPGAGKRSIRLISIQSLRDYIKSHSEETAR